MVTIYEKNKEIQDCMGYQTYQSWKKYKKIPYLVEKEVDDGVLWYNLFTREVIFLNPNDLRMIQSGGQVRVSTLVRNWFLIPEDIDGKTLVYGFWQKYYQKYPLVEKPLNLAVIFTTTECNARCPYCYEYGGEKSTMSEETAEQAADFIIRYAGDSMLLKWFGGEPLLNPKVIDIISAKMRDSGIKYRGSMVSNAYLFDRITDEQITDLWNLKDVQITVDGTRERYKQIKQLPDDGFDKALAAIKRLANLSVRVMVRLHVTPDNSDDMKQLVDEMRDYFSDMGKSKSYIHLYGALLFEGLGKNRDIHTEEERKLLYDDYIDVDNHIQKSGINYTGGIPGIRRTHCMADGGSSMVITPKGDITPCEHCFDHEIIGNIWEDRRPRVPDKWKERTAELPECANCFKYPVCFKLKMCEAEAPCNEDDRRYAMNSINKCLDRLYKQHLKRREDNAKSRGDSRTRGRIS